MPAVDRDSATNAGTVLLLIAGCDAQTAEQLTKDSGLDPAETARQLHRLTELGFIVAGGPDAPGLSVYRLNPKGVRTEMGDPQQRILVVDDTTAVRSLASLILEDAGYVVIAVVLPFNAIALLNEVDFDLVIVDSFSPVPDGTFASTRGVLEAAGTTPVALFSAHRIRLTDAQAAGFRAVVAKPFDLEVLEQQVRALLGG